MGLIDLTFQAAPAATPWFQDGRIIVPAIFSCLTIILGFAAWHYTREKLRLDLFNRRMEIYDLFYKSLHELATEPIENIILTNQLNFMKEKNHFIKINVHYIRFLFDKDIIRVYTIVAELRDHIISTLNKTDADSLLIRKFYQNNCGELLRDLPVIFRSYLKFSSFRMPGRQKPYFHWAFAPRDIEKFRPPHAALPPQSRAPDGLSAPAASPAASDPPTDR